MVKHSLGVVWNGAAQSARQSDLADNGSKLSPVCSPTKFARTSVSFYCPKGGIFLPDV
ncbi:hypothetical protein [Spirosoma migulaei]